MIIIMRHGEAVQYSEPDHTRALTRAGVGQCEGVGKWLNQCFQSLTQQSANLAKHQSEAKNANNVIVPASIDLALVSPYLRTQQSFQALSKHMNVVRSEISDLITPLADVTKIADLIHAYACDSAGPEHLLIVTHMPLVTLLSGEICADFEGQFFDTADTLVIDYDCACARGKTIAMFQGSVI